jgi:hypothetical protein
MAPSTKPDSQSLESNPSALGDPISIKSETTPSEHDLSAEPEGEARAQSEDENKAQRKGDGKSLKELAKNANPSMLGDPVSLKAETSNSEPTEMDRGALGGKERKGRGSKL